MRLARALRPRLGCLGCRRRSERVLDWLADPANSGALTAWSFLLTVGGFALTLAGLIATYIQAKSARTKAEEVEIEISSFALRSNKSEAIGLLGEAKTAMEYAGPLAASNEWKEASLAYDQARKALQRARVLNAGIQPKADRELKLVCQHLSDCSDMIDAALAEKGDYPEPHAIKSAVRRNTETLSRVQRQLQETI